MKGQSQNLSERYLANRYASVQSISRMTRQFQVMEKFKLSKLFRSMDVLVSGAQAENHVYLFGKSAVILDHCDGSWPWVVKESRTGRDQLHMEYTLR